jgi:hypothetical protein
MSGDIFIQQHSHKNESVHKILQSLFGKIVPDADAGQLTDFCQYLVHLHFSDSHLHRTVIIKGLADDH